MASASFGLREGLLAVDHVVDELEGVFEDIANQVGHGESPPARFAFERGLEVPRHPRLDQAILVSCCASLVKMVGHGFSSGLESSQHTLDQNVADLKLRTLLCVEHLT